MDTTYKKISTKIWRPVVDKLNRKLNKACLRRDAFLERVLEVELPHLDAEIPLANTAQAKAFVAERLDQLDRKLVSLSLRADLVDRLDEICARKEILRDAFFNRLFFLLAASPKVIDRVFFVLVGQEWRTEVWSERKHDGPFFQNIFYPLEQDVDPLWPIRTGLELYGEESDLVDFEHPVSGEKIQVKKVSDDRLELPERVYTVSIDSTTFRDQDLSGLNCYLPDWRIPGHPAELKFRKEMDELLESL